MSGGLAVLENEVDFPSCKLSVKDGMPDVWTVNVLGFFGRMSCSLSR